MCEIALYQASPSTHLYVLALVGGGESSLLPLLETCKGFPKPLVAKGILTDLQMAGTQSRIINAHF